MDKANHRGRAYRCKHCQRKGKTEINTKQRLEDHVYKYHVANDEQPYWCRLCLFRSRNKEGLYQHVNTFARHRNVMIEKGIEHSRPYLVCSLNPYVVSEKDIELLSKDESMTWWTKKELPSKKGNILERALEEADISFGEESPKLQFYLSDSEETKMATENLEKGMAIGRKDEKKFVERRDDEWYSESNVVLDLTVKHAGTSSDRIISIVEDVETYPLDLRVVKKRDDPNSDSKVVGDCGTVKESVVVEVTDQIMKAKATDCSSREESTCNRKEVVTDCMQEDIVDDSIQEEEIGYDIGDKEERKLKADSRKSRQKRRIRHSLKRHRSPSTSSSSSSDSSSSSSSGSSSDERENKFCKIMCEMIQKTGDIIGAQVVSNGEMINKLQRTVEELRKEVSDLKKERDAAIREKEEMITEQKEERREMQGGSSKSKSKQESAKKEENSKGKENQPEIKERSEEKSVHNSKRAFGRTDRGYEREGRDRESYRPTNRHHYGRRSWNFWNRGNYY